ncbi:chitinase-3-like protein 1 [Plakobranchus ocellatus]|uniref:Chitinase-3-like protein 1 n=1 Tax=Plakobranchus ocellatus TaxID=259542 RepID=A0AAV3ZVE5_9GAST|nr:chitinase-3-like protein 1 [Plakobranchus ocellatus]
MDVGVPFLSLALFYLLSIICQEGTAKEFLRLCYFPSWAGRRPSPSASYNIKDIDPHLCTHIAYAFGKIDPNSKVLVATSPSEEDSRPGFVGKFKQFTDLKKKNSRLKTLLSVGGQNDYGAGFKSVIENDVIAKTFAEDAVKFLRERSFDGLDIDWEYPTSATKQKFIILLKALREAFDNEKTNGQSKLVLTVAGPPGQQFIDPGYDIPNVARYADYVNLLTYDYTTIYATVTAFNSPLFSRRNIRFNPTLSTVNINSNCTKRSTEDFETARTTPIKSLYAEAGELSLKHRRIKLAFNYVLKLKSLPRNPCHDVVFEAPLSDFSVDSKSEPNLVADTFEQEC